MRDLPQTLNTTLKYKTLPPIPITIVKPDASFTLNITSSNGAKLSLTAKAKNIDTDATYNWTVIINKENTTNYTTPQIGPITIDGEIRIMSIELEITYVINGYTSSDIKRAEIEGYKDLEKHADGKDFELPLIDNS
jgi:hypothetical protein